MKTYEVRLWSGKGYLLNPPVKVVARDEEEALVLASIADHYCFYKEANDIPTGEVEEFDSADNYVYLDRSEFGHSNIYLLIENARISQKEEN